ncbi:MAG: B12-binding domain-containing radical SAM protein [Brevinematia bacterium]
MKEIFLYKYKKEKILWNAVLIYPNSYRTGMSSLGYLWVYHILQSIPWINCERAFFSPGRIKTIETERDIREFEIVFFSISFENDLINLISILKKAGIELFKEKRISPIICVGGIATTFISNYLKNIADVIFSGDAEATLPPFLEILKQTKDYDHLFSEIRNKKTDGIFLSEEINETLIPYISKKQEVPPHSSIITHNAEFNDSALISISSGCLYKCNFCLISRVYKEYKYFEAEKIIRTAEKYAGITNRIGLVAATLTNHPDFEKIIDEINRLGFYISFSSFRIEGLSEALLKKIIENENRTLVIAPETSSLGLKKFINKIIPDDLIIERVKTACNLGIKRIKLYFIVGLPGEKDEDIDGIIDLIRKIREVSKEYSKKFHYIPEIIVEINPFVPKPFTPLFDYEMEDINNLKKKIILIKNSVRGYGRTFIYGESPKSAYLQYVLSKNKLDFKELIEMAR